MIRVASGILVKEAIGTMDFLNPMGSVGGAIGGALGGQTGKTVGQAVMGGPVGAMRSAWGAGKQLMGQGNKNRVTSSGAPVQAGLRQGV